jgi:cell division protease FtsH
MRESDLHRQLITIVAGMAGELRAFGEVSSGVHDDLHAATQLARSMVSSFGMSPAIGPMTVGERQGEVFLGASLQDLGSIGDETLSTIDAEVRRILEESRERAGVVLGRNWGAVHETATSLLEHETLSGLALDAVLSTVEPAPIDELRKLARGGRDSV